MRTELVWLLNSTKPYMPEMENYKNMRYIYMHAKLCAYQKTLSEISRETERSFFCQVTQLLTREFIAYQLPFTLFHNAMHNSFNCNKQKSNRTCKYVIKDISIGLLNICYLCHVC